MWRLPRGVVPATLCSVLCNPWAQWHRARMRSCVCVLGLPTSGAILEGGGTFRRWNFAEGNESQGAGLKF